MPADVGFDVAADAYDRFMGRFSAQLAPRMADLAGVTAGQRVLDVGCGPGALTTELVGRVGASAVTAIDPSASFVAAARKRHPGVDVRLGSAEALPFDDDSFDAAIAQLVVHFMADPVAGLREMRRVTRPGGSVVACVWDHGGGEGPVSRFWEAAHVLDPDVDDESNLPGSNHGQLQELLRAAGLREVEEADIIASLAFPTFEAWWSTYEGGVGPAGSYVASLSAARRAELRDVCRSRLPVAPFELTARAWAARGTA